MSSKDWERYEEYREITHTKIIPALRELKEMGQALWMEQCGDIVKVARCVECGAMHYRGHTSCKCRWCLNCMYKKLLCWMACLLPLLQRWCADGNYLSLVNFTVRDAMPLKDPLGKLEGAYRVVYNGNLNGNRVKWKERFPGGIRSLEVKIGEGSGKWHPHYHALVMQEGGTYEKDYDWLSEAWHDAVGYRVKENGDPVVVVREDGTEDKDWNGNVWIKKVSAKKRSGIIEAVCETLKYILKPDKSVFGKKSRGMANIELFGEAYWTLKGKRQTSTWGLLYNIQEEVEEDFENEEEGALVEFICQRCGCTEAELFGILYSSITEWTVLLDMKKKRTPSPVGSRGVKTLNN